MSRGCVVGSEHPVVYGIAVWKVFVEAWNESFGDGFLGVHVEFEFLK